MKIRNGFVSNSSSSSFLIYGINLDSDRREMLIKHLHLTEDESECLYTYFSCHGDKPTFGLQFESIMGEEDFLGISWDKIEDNETGAQFKARVEKAIESVLGQKVKCETYKEAWRDG